MLIFFGIFAIFAENSRKPYAIFAKYFTIVALIKIGERYTSGPSYLDKEYPDG